MTPDFDIVWKKSAAKELQGTEHTFRLRVGDYRVVFQVSEPTHSITIVRVRHRRDVYRR